MFLPLVPQKQEMLDQSDKDVTIQKSMSGQKYSTGMTGVTSLCLTPPKVEIKTPVKTEKTNENHQIP